VPTSLIFHIPVQHMAQNIYDDPEFFLGYSQIPGRCMDSTAHPNGAQSKPCCLI
jgi:hypothetical protein